MTLATHSLPGAPSPQTLEAGQSAVKPANFTSLLERHSSKFDILPNGCWQWNASTAGKMGYANVWCTNQRRMRRAHRVFFEARNSCKIAKGMAACHACDNPKCVNPDHIWIGTQSDNMLDKHRKGRGGRRNSKGGVSHDGRSFAFVIQSNNVRFRKKSKLLCEVCRFRLTALTLTQLRNPLVCECKPHFSQRAEEHREAGRGFFAGISA